ncbi:phosphofructokinase [Artemisia annua]|uniref:Phosphofructokinase n=1 Tax=Artemisia annua TaxID=35608 RepID=A0A2U1KLH4_ARTAN|nr:phosphofructokinase [Artemisia annua]
MYKHHYLNVSVCLIIFMFKVKAVKDNNGNKSSSQICVSQVLKRCTQEVASSAHLLNNWIMCSKGGLLEYLGDRLKQNGHAVVVVTEGAGQDIIPGTDA